MPFALTDFKKYFSLPDDSIYLNCAAQGPLSKPASEAVVRSLHDKEYPSEMDHEYGTSRVQKCREAIAKLIGCEAKNVALANSTTWGVNLIAQGLSLKPGDEVAFFEGQFPANAAPWEPLTKKGVKLVRIPNPNFIIDVKSFVAHLSSKTKAVSLEWVHFVSGDRIPLAELTRLCHERGIFVIVDGTQGVGAIPFSMKEMGVDALVCSSYKWMYSPYGTGFLALRPEFIHALETTYVNWLSLDQAWPEVLSQYKVQYCDSARRFDTPSQMGYLNLDGMIASIEWLNSLDIGKNFLAVRELIAQLQSELNPKKFHAVNQGPADRQSCIATFTCTDFDVPGLVTKAQKEGMTICLRNGGVRISPSIYNDAPQISRFTNFVNKTI